MTAPQIVIVEMDVTDIPFLQQLWQMKHVRRYADELPHFRGWSRTDPISVAWAAYQARCQRFGAAYRQLILCVGDRTPIGESFYAPVATDVAADPWPSATHPQTLLGDIKIHPTYWHVGYGSAGMRGVVEYVFTHTLCARFVVPPHRKNLAAVRVYEKAGFLATGQVIWGSHQVLELTRARFDALDREDD